MSGGGEPLPPKVDADVEHDSLLAYWRSRARQHVQDVYAGVPLSKFPEDLRVYEHLLWSAAPDTVVEIGTQAGGSALWFRDRLRTLQAYGRIARAPRVISVDVDQSLARRHLPAADPRWEEAITLIEADVTDRATADLVRAVVGEDARCLVIEDAAHTYATTTAALEAFAPLVAPGGYFVVEDGCVDVEALRVDPDWPRGVLPAIDDWLHSPAGAAFARRPDLERYGITCHPGGFLQRREESLEAELASGVGWMYPWDLGTGEPLPLLNPELPEIHRTRAELIEGPVREALAAAGAGASALDLACSEGWFAHRLLDWGAERVVAVDLRAENVRRARLLRDRHGIAPARLDVREADLFTLDPEVLGTFDVVLLLGLIYHVEDPVGALRLARRCTRTLCAIETQLTRQRDPLTHGWGVTDAVEQAAGSFAVRVEHDAQINPVASEPGIVSLIPNRDAVEAALAAAGFSRWEWPAPAPDHNRQYLDGDRGVVLAWA